jgi:hypothetical protein
LNSSTSAGDIAAKVGRVLGDPNAVIAQNSSKSAKVRYTVICRVSTASRPAPILTHRSDSRRFNARRIHRLNPHGAQLDADRLQCETAAQYVPGIGLNDATRTHHPRHLGDTLSGIGQKKYH